MAERSDINQWIKDAREAFLNLIIVSPHSIQKDETFLDLDASIAELERTNQDNRDEIIMAVKEVGRTITNFIRVHPEYGKDPKFLPLIQDLKKALQNLLNI